jgi:hypothetical protein
MVLIWLRIKNSESCCSQSLAFFWTPGTLTFKSNRCGCIFFHHLGKVWQTHPLVWIIFCCLKFIKTLKSMHAHAKDYNIVIEDFCILYNRFLVAWRQLYKWRSHRTWCRCRSRRRCSPFWVGPREVQVSYTWGPQSVRTHEGRSQEAQASASEAQGSPSKSSLRPKKCQDTWGKARGSPGKSS